jgi:hypothetical protein
MEAGGRLSCPFRFEQAREAHVWRVAGGVQLAAQAQAACGEVDGQALRGRGVRAALDLRAATRLFFRQDRVQVIVGRHGQQQQHTLVYSRKAELAEKGGRQGGERLE